MLKLENITKYYYSSSSVTCALRKINLEFKIGEFVAITGESGSGKTTLLNIISGLDSYEDGEMYFGNKKTSFFDAKDWEKYRKEEISFIFQNYNLIDSFSVLENVMVAFIIDGYSYNQAKTKAKEVLKFVGLENDIRKRASKLSGGQKQRLAIARALAKETNIIVADEPTGNLDSENGVAILQLLKKISKDKLVIVVTHNLGQIEPFITRKIRLHDGEVALDETYKVSDCLVNKTNSKDKEKELKKISNFSFLNIKSQPNKSVLLFLLVFICTLSTFIFYGNFKMNIDDHKTKNLDNSIFINMDDTRMLVKKTDSSIVNDEMFDEVMVKHVKSAEKYDYITDVNYYRDGDYQTVFAGGYVPNPNDPTGMPPVFEDKSYIQLLNHNKYMRSYNTLSENMLKAGRLPTNDNEMVVYSNNLSILDTTEKVLFRNDRIQSIDNYYSFNVKVVGVLKENTSQAYFSENICKLMDLTQYKKNITISYYVEVNNRKQLKSYSFSEILINPTLKDYDICVNSSLADSLKYNTIIDFENNVALSIGGYTEITTLKFSLNDYIDGNSKTIGVSKELFDKIYSNFENKTQFAIFADDYAYIDDINNSLAKLGYETLSCYKASATEYNIEKVIIRYVNLAVSIVSLVLVNLIIVLLCNTILKVKKNDYIIFKMIGLSNDLCKKINYVEVSTYGLISNILLWIICAITKNVSNIELINNLFKYVRFYDYILILLIIAISMIMVGRKFGKFLTKNLKVTMLKEE